MPDYYGDSDRLIGKRVDLGNGRSAFIAGTMAMDASGNPASGQTYQLASNQTIAATSGTSPVSGIQGGSYLWDVQIPANSSITLQALGSDGVTWRDVSTRTTSGTTPVVIGQNASVRLYNPGASAIAGVFSNLS